MSAPARIRQADMTRAVKAVVMAGLRVSGIVCRPDGTIIVRTVDAPPTDDVPLSPPAEAEEREWDEATL